MKKSIIPFVMGVIAVAMFSACEKDDEEDPVIPNEEELITTVRFHMVPASGGDTITWTFTDLDGDGGDAPVIVNGAALVAGVTYGTHLEFLNEVEDPIEDITEEVEDEAEEHQVFYMVDGADMTVSYTDSDANGFPLGLTTEVMTQSASSGSLEIILRHEPEKDEAGVSDGDITNAGGETDIEVSFDITIQ
ncbi:MAG: type 1 periplasmic binding fold superfamily protein [Flavobacteriales bacterium]|nr:type 1 periplasmic binding fold superfamily protein [Flavobacteriales bacterium]